MSKNLRWPLKAFQDKNLIKVKGVFIDASTQVAKGKVVKLPLIGSDEKPKPNAKIKNATKSVVDGIAFDSNLEKHMYDLLKGAGVAFEFQKVFVLQDKFKYGTENVRAITKIVDFYLSTRNMVIDTKGYNNDVSPLKHKMLKWALKTNYGIEPKIEMPSTKKECELLLNRLLFQP